MVPLRYKQITLNWADMAIGAQVGVMRRLKNKMKYKRKDGYGMKGLGWNEEIHGAIGELAFSRMLGVSWDNMIADDANKRPDVGGFEVKAVSEPNYRLIVRDNDEPEKLMALVYGEGCTFTAVGWIRADDGRRLGSVESHQGRACQYYVDQKYLHPFEER